MKYYKDDYQDVNLDKPATKRGQSRRGLHKRTREDKGFKITQAELRKMKGYTKPIGPQV